MGPPPASFPEVGLHNGFPPGIDCFGRDQQDEAGVFAAAGDFDARGNFPMIVFCIAWHESRKVCTYRLKTDWASYQILRI